MYSVCCFCLWACCVHLHHTFCLQVPLSFEVADTNKHSSHRRHRNVTVLGNGGCFSWMQNSSFFDVIDQTPGFHQCCHFHQCLKLESQITIRRLVLWFETGLDLPATVCMKIGSPKRRQVQIHLWNVALLFSGYFFRFCSVLRTHTCDCILPIRCVHISYTHRQYTDTSPRYCCCFHQTA